ncbi:hypothetical protein D3C77_773970 [compost metagenome]
MHYVADFLHFHQMLVLSLTVRRSWNPATVLLDIGLEGGCDELPIDFSSTLIDPEAIDNTGVAMTGLG